MSIRRAALCLHGLDDMDRDWIMDNLHERFRERLIPMLKELQQMGIPKEQTWLPEIVSETASDITSEFGVVDEYLIRIDQASVESISSVLADEPDGVILALVMQRDWKWRESYLSTLTPQKRQRLVTDLKASRSELTHKVKETLLQTVVLRLDEYALSQISTETSDFQIPDRKSRLNGWKKLWLR